MNLFVRWLVGGGGLDLPALSIHNWCLVLIRSGSLRLRKNSFRQAATSWTWFTPCCSTTEWASETGTIATGENQKRERKGKGRKMCYCLWWILFTELLHSLTQLYCLYTCSFPQDTNISPIVHKTLFFRALYVFFDTFNS